MCLVILQVSLLSLFAIKWQIIFSFAILNDTASRSQVTWMQLLYILTLRSSEISIVGNHNNSLLFTSDCYISYYWLITRMTHMWSHTFFLTEFMDYFMKNIIFSHLESCSTLRRYIAGQLTFRKVCTIWYSSWWSLSPHHYSCHQKENKPTFLICCWIY